MRIEEFFEKVRLIVIGLSERGWVEHVWPWKDEFFDLYDCYELGFGVAS